MGKYLPPVPLVIPAGIVEAWRGLALTINAMIADEGLPWRWDALERTGQEIGPDGYMLWSASDTSSLALAFVLPGGWEEGTDVLPVLHWRKTTSAAGTVTWQTRSAWANAGSAYPALSAFAGGTVQQSDGNTVDQHATIEMAAVAGAGKKIGSVILLEVRRNGGTYAANARLDAVQLLYHRVSRGSQGRYVAYTR